jgi:hypothetical protein
MSGMSAYTRWIRNGHIGETSSGNLVILQWVTPAAKPSG